MKRYKVITKPSRYTSHVYELQIYVDGILIDCYYDFGEPEDNSFVRDYAWVSKELEKAYKLGYQHALESERYGDAEV